MLRLFSFFFTVLPAMLGAQSAQHTSAITRTMNSNPLICDPEDGMCIMPGPTATGSETAPSTAVKIVYFTDPICSSCWGIEPQLRKLKLEYGDNLDIEYRMGGLLPSWDVYNSGGISKPSDVAHHWDEVSRYYDMPIDGDIWLEDPLPSSYPPSIAFKAAQMQDSKKAVVFLRELRERLFLQKKNVTKWEYVQQAAEAAGLDANRLQADMEGPAKKLFEDDLALARQMGVRGFPTLFFSNEAGQQEKVYGVKPYEQFERAVLQIFPTASKKAIDPSWQSLFGHYPTLTAKEFSVLSNTPRVEAERLLLALSQSGHLSVLETKNGRMWQKI